MIQHHGMNNVICKSRDDLDQSYDLLFARLIPSQGNTADIVLTVLHRNFLGVDEFLGRVDVPLRDFDVYERPRSRWYQLKCKSGQNKNDYRGEIEVKIGFTVKASSTFGGSATDLSKKNRGSIPSLQKVSNQEPISFMLKSISCSCLVV